MTLEAPVSVCELATRFALEDEQEAQRVRFALKVDAESRRTGLPPVTFVTSFGMTYQRDHQSRGGKNKAANGRAA